MLYFIVFGARNMPRQKPKRKTSSPYARPQSDNDKPKSKDDSVTSASILQPPMDAPSASTADPKPHQDTPSTEGTVEAYQNSDDLKFIDFQPMPILSTNFALGHNVSEKLREKIVKGFYVDMASLLANSNTQEEGEKIMTVNSKGELVSKVKNTKTISNIKMWTDAFLIYMSIYTSVHKDKFQSRLKYAHDVRLGAERSGNWKSYDEQFRLKLVSNPAKSWGDIDTELWVMYMGGTLQTTSGATFYSGVRKCYSFNYQGFCTNSPCYYVHACMKCFANHPSIYCIAAGPHASARPPLDPNGQIAIFDPSASGGDHPSRDTALSTWSPE